MPSTDASTLEERLKKRTDKVLRRGVRALKTAASVTSEEVINATPVDTGEARSNWRISVGSTVDVRHAPFFPLPKGTDPFKYFESANANTAIELANATIQEIPEQTLIDGVPFYLQNHAPQTAWINTGKVSSAQQNPLFVEQAVATGRATLSQGKGK